MLVSWLLTCFGVCFLLFMYMFMLSPRAGIFSEVKGYILSDNRSILLFVIRQVLTNEKPGFNFPAVPPGNLGN